MLSVCSSVKTSLQFQDITCSSCSEYYFRTFAPDLDSQYTWTLPYSSIYNRHSTSPWLSQAAFRLLLQWPCSPVSAYLLQLQRPVDRCDICALHPRWLPLFWIHGILSASVITMRLFCASYLISPAAWAASWMLFDHGFIEIYIVGTCSWTLEILFISHNYRILVRLRMYLKLSFLAVLIYGISTYKNTEKLIYPIKQYIFNARSTGRKVVRKEVRYDRYTEKLAEALMATGDFANEADMIRTAIQTLYSEYAAHIIPVVLKSRNMKIYTGLRMNWRKRQ